MKHFAQEQCKNNPMPDRVREERERAVAELRFQGTTVRPGAVAASASAPGAGHTGSSSSECWSWSQNDNNNWWNNTGNRWEHTPSRYPPGRWRRSADARESTHEERRSVGRGREAAQDPSPFAHVSGWAMMCLVVIGSSTASRAALTMYGLYRVVEVVYLLPLSVSELLQKILR